ncbi:CDP-glycerol glycerophosphotransferase family protein [Terrabacter sp. NPDC080008]|uniref:bifunctional glycosyltransferase/CDP-glycerol:glycerophosphate glycerophosphotransferase n=1 Tax=Terrabacter sp. NPDC080008 TaxID=3155176 RepID=UPI00344EA8DA
MPIADERPLLGAIVPTYGVEQYLPAFLRSLEEQEVPIAEVELIFVDDGSPDRSAEIIQAWLADHAPHGRLISQENAGPSAARNTGLEQATAEWVHFPDPDDVLHPRFYAEVKTFLGTRQSATTDLISTRQLILDDATGRVTDTHPLRRKFRGGDQLVDLTRHPEYIHLQSGTAFYRRERIESRRLAFDGTIRPNFEDAYFTALYLAGSLKPRVAVLANAHYHYRRRQDGSSLVQSSWHKPDKYVHLPRVGYLRLAETVKAELGHVPVWLQTLLLYDLSFYFREDERIHSATAWIDAPLVDAFHETVERIFQYIDTETIEGFTLVPTSLQLRQALVVGFKHERLRPTSLPLIRVDSGREIVQIRYFYGGELPTEEYRVRGLPIQPVHSKVRDITYLGRVLMHERIVWLPADGTIRVALDGRQVPLTLGAPQEPTFVMRPAVLWRTLTRHSGPPSARASRPQTPQRSRVRKSASSAKKRVKRTLKAANRNVEAVKRSWTQEARVERADKRLRERAHSESVKTRYGHAWTFMDRDVQAQDNAEHLYRHVRDRHPEINSWFVLSRTSSDWERLSAEGFRLVDHGSDEHIMLLLNTDHLISSQVDHYVVNPLDAKRHGRKHWRFTFLQHGVTKDDLSRWVNGKPISLFVTASTDEHESIVGDHTPYIFTTKEVSLTGFPRHDRLLELASASRERSLLLVMPTWRRTLLGDLVNASGGNERMLIPNFWEGEYAVNWMSVLASPELKAVAEQNGLEIVFMPHPNMQGYLDSSPLPPHIRVCKYSDTDIQQVLAQGAVMVTDYSSLAFEMAYIERPVVYFQFDQDEFFGGGHAYRRGSWSYEDNGFGPVTTTTEDAIAAIARAAAQSGQPDEVYAQRMGHIFPHRDGQCSERVVEAIISLDRPLPASKAYVQVAQAKTDLDLHTGADLAVQEVSAPVEVDREAEAAPVAVGGALDTL